jgi:hypothetical protein
MIDWVGEIEGVEWVRSWSSCWWSRVGEYWCWFLGRVVDWYEAEEVKGPWI